MWVLEAPWLFEFDMEFEFEFRNGKLAIEARHRETRNWTFGTTRPGFAFHELP
jgi:hypothetical protein